MIKMAATPAPSLDIFFTADFNCRLIKRILYLWEIPKKNWEKMTLTSLMQRKAKPWVFSAKVIFFTEISPNTVGFSYRTTPD